MGRQRGRSQSRGRFRGKMRDLHHVYKSLEINNSNNDLQQEAEHSELFLFPLEQPKVEAQPTVDEWQMVKEQAPVMQYLTQFLKIFKDAIPHLQEAVDPDLDLVLEVKEKQQHLESVEPNPKAGSDTAVH